MINAEKTAPPGTSERNDEPTLATFLDTLYVKKGESYKGLTVFPISFVSAEFIRGDEPFEVLGKEDGENKIHFKESVNLNSAMLINSGRQRAVALDGTVISDAAKSLIIGSSAILDRGEIIELPACGTTLARSGLSPGAKFPLIYTQSIATHKRLVRIESLKRMKNDEPNMNQRKVWSDLRDLFVAAGFNTPSMDVEDLYLHWTASIKDYTWRFKTEQLQVGMITFLGTDMWFIDLFLNTELFKEALPALIKSYALDAAIRRSGEQEEVFRERIPDIDDAREAFDYMRCLNYTPMKFKGAEIKNSFYFDELNACGTLLVNNGQMVHLVAYSKDKPPREY